MTPNDVLMTVRYILQDANHMGKKTNEEETTSDLKNSFTLPLQFTKICLRLCDSSKDLASYKNPLEPIS